MGILVSLSGLDGSGKTTQGQKLYVNCMNSGFRPYYIHLKEVDSKFFYSQAVMNTKRYLRDNALETVNETRNIISAFLFMQKVEHIVVPNLEKYDVVIVDRYRESAKCYHLLKGKLSNHVLKLYENVVNPDVNIFFDLDLEECCHRLNQRVTKTMYENYNSLQKAYEYYESQKNKFIWLDANRSVSEIANEVFDLVKKILNEKEQK